MMNYSCVVIEKEVLVKEAFSNKVEACEYFDAKYGEDIANDRMFKEKKILSSIARCEAKILKFQYENEVQDITQEERTKKLEQALDLKRRREEELRRLNEERASVCCYYDWSFEEYKEELLDGTKGVLLRVCGIYNTAGGMYEVLEEVYKVVSTVIENVSSMSEVMDKLPDRFKGRHVAMFCAPKDNERYARFSRFICRIRQQVLREHKKCINKAGNEVIA